VSSHISSHGVYTVCVQSHWQSWFLHTQHKHHDCQSRLDTQYKNHDCQSRLDTHSIKTMTANVTGHTQYKHHD
jgi:hypothetical protein